MAFPFVSKGPDGNAAGGPGSVAAQSGGEPKKTAADAWQVAMDAAKTAAALSKQGESEAADRLDEAAAEGASDFSEGEIGSGLGRIAKGAWKAGEAFIAGNWKAATTILSGGVQSSERFVDGLTADGHGISNDIREKAGNAGGHAAGSLASNLGRTVVDRAAMRLYVGVGAMNAGAETVTFLGDRAGDGYRYATDADYRASVNAKVSAIADEVAAHPAETARTAASAAADLAKDTVHNAWEAISAGDIKAMGMTTGEFFTPGSLLAKLRRGAKIAKVVEGDGKGSGTPDAPPTPKTDEATPKSSTPADADRPQTTPESAVRTSNTEHTPPDKPVVKVWRRTPDDNIVAKEFNGKHNSFYYIESKIYKDGVIEFDIMSTKNHPGEINYGLRGENLFNKMMDFYGNDTKGIYGRWVNPEKSAKNKNLGRVNELTAAGMKLEDAVYKTWTADVAKTRGFTTVNVVDSKGSAGKYTAIDVWITP